MLKNRTIIKVCGMTRRKDIKYAVNIGVDALGFILAKSPRQLKLPEVEKLTLNLPPFISRIAVVVDPSRKEILAIENSGLFNYLQFHGKEDPKLLNRTSLNTIKAISIAQKEDLKEVEKYQDYADYLLFDTKIGSCRGGTGESFNWSLIKNLKLPYILAGGLGKDNINQALTELKPTAVDLNSKLENSPGQKNHRLLRETVEEIRSFRPESRAKIKLKSN